MDHAIELTEVEAAYVRRFCYEVWHGHEGPGTTLIACRGYYTSHYYDLATLATVSDIQYDERLIPRYLRNPAEERESDVPPPSVPFPWSSLEALHDRAADLATMSEKGRAVFSLTTPRGVS